MKINQIGRSILTNSFFSRMVQMRRCFLTTYTKPLHEEKNIKQMCYYGKEKGRSMVEMLGVLAIIGVLSVGAISGYQKAIMKYKLNKHATSFNMLLANALQISPSIPLAKTSNSLFYNEMLLKANLLPDGVTFKNIAYLENPNYLEDFMGNKIRFFSRYGFGYSFGLTVYVENNSYGAEVCQNIINIAKEHSSNIINLAREDKTTGGGYASTSIYTNCSNSKGTCFKNLSITDIGNICQISDSKKNNRGYYEFHILW